MHMFAYLFAAFFGFWGYRSFTFKICVAVLLYSAVMEWVQLFIPSRYFNYWDIVGNIVGILCALLLRFYIFHNETIKNILSDE